MVQWHNGTTEEGGATCTRCCLKGGVSGVLSAWPGDDGINLNSLVDLHENNDNPWKVGIGNEMPPAQVLD